jgi:hypothetical protein
VIVSVLRSVARRRLVKAENLSVCATANCKFCKSAIALYLSVIIYILPRVGGTRVENNGF